MTDTAKLNRLKILLGEDLPEDSVLSEYIAMAGEEIINWLYIRRDQIPEGVAVPTAYEQVQIMSVIAAVNIIGAEGETLHIENGTHRQFKYDDMVAYIRAHVQPYAYI